MPFLRGVKGVIDDIDSAVCIADPLSTPQRAVQIIRWFVICACVPSFCRFFREVSSCHPSISSRHERVTSISQKRTHEP